MNIKRGAILLGLFLSLKHNSKFIFILKTIFVNVNYTDEWGSKK